VVGHGVGSGYCGGKRGDKERKRKTLGLGV